MRPLKVNIACDMLYILLSSSHVSDRKHLLVHDGKRLRYNSSIGSLINVNNRLAYSAPKSRQYFAVIVVGSLNKKIESNLIEIP